ncbi:hypothetical protein K504DRAFT_486615 [Pleomassaria siparia CBS 279.74]|uniref:Uncharacterized protein n=1 Tax=Pleomassaria siparia CBS 279.74 TaxID=1314801 RepID=A0A6G1KPM8_9PLEO|nr:hypothetical protein K504DRAFT_486615 [Pleomassaria siparia CBS 279.74]
MKKNFSFNLAPLVHMSKAESAIITKDKSTPEPSLSHAPTLSHHRHHSSKDSITMLNSPFINRRPLSPKTEQELRSACALILQNFKPSDHDIPDELKSRLDIRGTRRKDHGTGPVRVHRPTGAPAEPRSTHDVGKHTSHHHHHVRKDGPVLPPTENLGRRRTEHPEGARVAASKYSSNMIPSATAIRDAMDADDDESLNSPITSSTESHLNHGSTAPTSAAYTSGRNSKRTSHQLESAAAVADAQAAEWMRQELDKRRKQLASQSQPQLENPSLARAPSRTRSIRSDIKEYIFPGSTTLSRSTSKQMGRKESHESLRSQSSSSKEPRRSGSSQGWRSWGLQRKFSSRSNSRPGTSKGRLEGQTLDKKSELNLNRELPPLPSLDTWKQPESPTQRLHRQSQGPGAHIATLMRPQDQQQQDYAAAVRRHHRRSGSDTMALRYASSGYHQAAPQIARTASLRKPRVVSTLKRTTTGPATSTAMDFDHLMSIMDDTSKNFNDQLVLHDHTHHQNSSHIALQSPTTSTKMSSDQGRLDLPPNFSRKISGEIPSSQRDESVYPNLVQLGPQTPKSSQKSKLKKVFSTWMLKKEKKDNWMDQLEKNGVKEGLMIPQDEAALPPVVRY